MKQLLLSALLGLFLAVPSQAQVVVFNANLSGPNESPPNVSTATGTLAGDYDPATHLIHFSVTFSGLLGTTTAAHIHCCTDIPLMGTAGVATDVPSFPGFPMGLHAGMFDTTFDLTAASSYNPAFISAHGGTVMGAESFLVAGIRASDAYFNIHTTAFPGGEIRGFIVAVPEPASALLLLLGLAALAVVQRRRA